LAEFDNTNRGALFKNNRKEKDTQPDYTGSLNVGGVDHFLDAWLKTDKNGNKFMSVSVKRKDKQPEAARPAEPTRAPQRAAPKTGFDDMHDEIPF
jgi:uncharacterized protein (DUF736 family)